MSRSALAMEKATMRPPCWRIITGATKRAMKKRLSKFPANISRQPAGVSSSRFSR